MKDNLNKMIETRMIDQVLSNNIPHTLKNTLTTHSSIKIEVTQLHVLQKKLGKGNPEEEIEQARELAHQIANRLCVFKLLDNLYGLERDSNK